MPVPADLTALRNYIIKKFAKRGTTSIGDDTSLVKSGWIDSFGVVDVVAFIESEYGIHIPDGEVVPEHFENLATIAQLLKRCA
jgi:acyl carrier protein